MKRSNNMKKILSLILAALMCAALLTGCGGDGGLSLIHI